MFQPMQRAAALAIMLTLMTLVLACGARKGERAQRSLDDALAQAFAENKPVLIEFYTDW